MIGSTKSVHALLGDFARGVAQVLDYKPMPCPVGAGRQQSGHDVQALRPKRPCIVERLGHAGTELLFAARQGGEAPFAGRPVAWRHVEQGVDEPVLLQPACHLLRRMIIGEQELDAFEARPCSPSKRSGRAPR